MNALPLPERNPQDLWMLKQGEIKSWTIVLMDINPLGEFEHVIHKATGIPMISIDRTTYVPEKPHLLKFCLVLKISKCWMIKGRS